MESKVPGYYEHPVVGGMLGPIGLVIACTAESAEALLSSKTNANKGFSHQLLKPWLGNGLLSNPGDASWRTHRKMLTPTMHFRILEDYRRTMNVSAMHFIEKLRRLGNQQVDVYPMIRMCTFGIVFETAFGISVDENDPDHLNFLSDCDELAYLIVARMMNLPQWFETILQYTSTGRRMGAASDRVTAYINKVIDSKLVSLHNNNETGKSFIDTVIAMFREGLLTRHDVRDHVATFIVGGFDTTATAMAYNLHLLAHHPEIQEKLLNEVKSVVEDGKDVTKEQLGDLKLIEAQRIDWLKVLIVDLTQPGRSFMLLSIILGIHPSVPSATAHHTEHRYTGQSRKSRDTPWNCRNRRHIPPPPESQSLGGSIGVQTFKVP